MVRDFIDENKAGVWCKIGGEEDKCEYFQKKINAGNFVRHFRSAHFALAKSKRFFRDEEIEPKSKKPRKR